MGEPHTGNTAEAAPATKGAATTPDATTYAATVAALRQQIDRLDEEIIRLCGERLQISREIVDLRLHNGEPLVVPARERDIRRRYRAGLGPAGDELASLLLRAGRGPV